MESSVSDEPDNIWLLLISPLQVMPVCVYEFILFTIIAKNTLRLFDAGVGTSIHVSPAASISNELNLRDQK